VRTIARQEATERRRIALSVEEAAEALGVSRDSFERHVMAELRLVRIGRRLLVPTRELERWIEREMAIPLVAELSHPRTERPLFGEHGAE
jgi:excisionase family DNA binding protein